MDEYYLYCEGQQTGPFTAEQVRSMLRANHFPLEVYFWKHGFAEWRELFPGDPKKSGSPKQLARLNYFGVRVPIAAVWVFDLIHDDEKNPAMRSKIQEWHRDKHRLHPELFPLDVRTIEDARYWRGRLFGEDSLFTDEFRKPTNDTILAVLNSLDGSDPGWHRADHAKADESFLLELATLYPELCKKDCTYAF